MKTFFINKYLLPSHCPEANVVLLVHVSNPPEHVGKVQSVQITLSPINTLAKVDLPTPVCPRIKIVGLGKSVYATINNGQKNRNMQYNAIFMI